MEKIKKKYEYKESYLHKSAKDLLVTELKREEQKNEDYCSFGKIAWRTNYGIFSELPFHETDDLYYFECSEGIKKYDGYDENSNDKRGKNPLDWFDPSYNRGKILFVPDITIFHKGTPVFFIEVVHTHYMEDEKANKILKFFDNSPPKIYEVSAYDILCCTNEQQLREIGFRSYWREDNG